MLDPDDLEEPHAERLSATSCSQQAEIRKVDTQRAPARRGARGRRPPSAPARQWRASEPPLRAAGQPGLGRGQGAEGAAGRARRARPPRRRRTARSPRAASSTPPRRPRAPPAQGETVAALGGDGLLRPLAGALKGADTGAGAGPLRARQRPRARARDPDRPGGGRAARGRGRASACSTWPSVDGTPFMGIASFGFDSDANRIANEARLVKGNAVYLYAALRALAAWKPARFTVTVDGERHEMTGYTVAVGNSKAYGGGMFVLPHAELDDGQLDVLLSKERSKLTFLRELPKVFKGSPRGLAPRASSCAGELIEVALRPPLRDLRRRRPDRRHPGHDPRASRAACGSSPRRPDVRSPRAALRPARCGPPAAASAAAAAPPRPGRMLLRLAPGRAASAWPASSRTARCSCPPPTARPPPRR